MNSFRALTRITKKLSQNRSISKCMDHGDMSTSDVEPIHLFGCESVVSSPIYSLIRCVQGLLLDDDEDLEHKQICTIM